MTKIVFLQPKEQVSAMEKNQISPSQLSLVRDQTDIT